MATDVKRAQLGQKIRTARKHAGLSHDQLGALVGTSRQHLIKLEKGQHAPRDGMLQKIADATGKTLDFFRDGDQADEDEEADAAMLAALAPFRDLVDRLVDLKLAQREGARA